MHRCIRMQRRFRSRSVELHDLTRWIIWVDRTQLVARVYRYDDHVSMRIDLHCVVIGESGQLVRKVFGPVSVSPVSVVTIRAEADECIPATVVARMTPDHATRRVPGGPPPGVQDRRRMPGPVPPNQRVEIEKMRNRGGLDPWAQLRLAFEQDVIVANRVILDVVVRMRRKRGAIGIHRVRIARARAVVVCGAGDVSIRDSSPLTRRYIERVNVGAEIVVVATAEHDHRSAATVSRREDRAVPTLGNGAESRNPMPRRLGFAADPATQSLLGCAGGVQAGIACRIRVDQVPRSRCCGQ